MSIDIKELKIEGEAAWELLEVLDTLFVQADEDCPGEYRTEHFRSALTDALDKLCEYGIRVRLNSE